jgi:hypothetical protein
MKCRALTVAHLTPILRPVVSLFMEIDPELRHTRDIAGDLVRYIDVYEESFTPTCPHPEAVLAACDRLREALIEALRKACEELGPPLPAEIDLILGPRARSIESMRPLSMGESSGSTPDARSIHEAKKCKATV